MLVRLQPLALILFSILSINVNTLLFILDFGDSPPDAVKRRTVHTINHRIMYDQTPHSVRTRGRSSRGPRRAIGKMLFMVRFLKFLLMVL